MGVKHRTSSPSARHSMANQLKVLRTGAIIAAVWSCIFCVIQVSIMGWQLKVLKALQYELDNRQVPDIPGFDTFRARSPNILQRYTETPERRRVNLLFVIGLINLFLTVGHFILSVLLLFGSIKNIRNCVWPWFLTVIPSILMSTVYSVIWWSGDVFNEQLIMSYIEFFMAIPLNSVALGWIMFYYMRLTGINLFNRKQKNIKKKKPPNTTGKAHLLHPEWSEYRHSGMPDGVRPQWSGHMNPIPGPQQVPPIGQPQTLPRQSQQSAVHQHMHHQSPSKTNQIVNPNGKTYPNYARGPVQMAQRSNQPQTHYEQQHFHSMPHRLQQAHQVEYQQQQQQKQQQQWNPHRQPTVKPRIPLPQLQPFTAPPHNMPTLRTYQYQHHEKTLPPELFWQPERQPQHQYNASSRYPVIPDPQLYTKKRSPM